MLELSTVHGSQSTVHSLRTTVRCSSVHSPLVKLRAFCILWFRCVLPLPLPLPPPARADAFLSLASGGHQSWRKRVGQSSTQLHLQPVRRLPSPLLLPLHPSNNCRRAALFADGCRSLLNKTHNKRRVAVFYLFLLPPPRLLQLLL